MNDHGEPQASWAVDESYLDDELMVHRSPDWTTSRLRALIGMPAADTPAPPLIIGQRWSSDLTAVIELEHGEVVSAPAGVEIELPLGYHQVHPEGGPARQLIVTPRHCILPPRMWGLTTQLYAARSRRSWGIGDLIDLRTLRLWTSRRGGGFVLVNPIHAPAPTAVQEDCPYAPATRLFRSPLYLRPDEVPGAAAVDLSTALRAACDLNRCPRIDRDTVWSLKREALWQIFTATIERRDFDEWRLRQESELELYATWCALAERFGPSWPHWPKEFRISTDRRVADFAAQHHMVVAFHAWLQWLIAAQSTGEGAGVVHDLAVGVAPDGADVWIWPDAFVSDVTTGAPPDALNVNGQDWGLAPLHPWRLGTAGYQPFIKLLRAAFAGANGIRLDHVLGLFRMWCMPAGASAADGAYVRYPAADLLAILALESHRANAFVIGEDLGMVERGTRERLDMSGVLSSRVLLLDTSPPDEWPSCSLATATTHDLPTVTGLWSGADIADQHHDSSWTGEDATLALRDKLALRTGSSIDDDPAGVVEAAHRAILEGPSRLVGLAVEDLLGAEHRANIPGTKRAENWTRPLPVSLDDLAGLEARLLPPPSGLVGAT